MCKCCKVTVSLWQATAERVCNTTSSADAHSNSPRVVSCVRVNPLTFHFPFFHITWRRISKRTHLTPTEWGSTWRQKWESLKWISLPPITDFFHISLRLLKKCLDFASPPHLSLFKKGLLEGFMVLAWSCGFYWSSGRVKWGRTVVGRLFEGSKGAETFQSILMTQNKSKQLHLRDILTQTLYFAEQQVFDFFVQFFQTKVQT
jgi:hypothetical protein